MSLTDAYKDILNRESTTARILTAPRSAVVSAWTDAEKLKRWWGPNGFTNTFHTFECKPGGLWTFTMHSPTGADYANEMRFVEVGQERIVLEHISAPQFLLTATFDDLGGRTKVTFRQLFPTAAMHAQIRPLVTDANEQNLDRLQQVVAAS